MMMTKDEAEAIHTLARQLLEEDVSVETRCRLARKIIEHAKAIKADPAVKFGGNGQTGSVSGSKPATPPESPVIFEPVAYSYPGFTPVRIKYTDWISQPPEYDGERILWRDGTAHGMPEDIGEYVTVLRSDDVIRSEYGTPIVFEWPASKETTHVPANYG